MFKISKVSDRVALRLNSIRVPLLVTKAVQLQDKLERLISKKDKRAFRLLQHVVEVMPDFFMREHVAASKIILNYMRAKREQCRSGKLHETKEFGNYLEELVTEMRGVPYPKRLIAYNKFKLQSLRIRDMHGDESETANFFAKAAVCHPEYIDKPEFFASPQLADMARELCNTINLIDKSRLKF